jgi:hypothetical protein
VRVFLAGSRTELGPHKESRVYMASDGDEDDVGGASILVNAPESGTRDDDRFSVELQDGSQKQLSSMQSVGVVEVSPHAWQIPT